MFIKPYGKYFKIYNSGIEMYCDHRGWFWYYNAEWTAWGHSSLNLSWYCMRIKIINNPPHIFDDYRKLDIDNDFVGYRPIRNTIPWWRRFI
jgi:hypothetical protein